MHDFYVHCSNLCRITVLLILLPRPHKVSFQDHAIGGDITECSRGFSPLFSLVSALLFSLSLQPHSSALPQAKTVLACEQMDVSLNLDPDFSFSLLAY